MKVWVVQDWDTGAILGIFDSYEKADRFRGDSRFIDLIEWDLT